MYYLPGGKFQSWAPQSGRRGHRRDERTVSWSGNALMKMQFLKLFLGFVMVLRNGCVFVTLSWGSLVSTTFQKGWQKKLAAHPQLTFKKEVAVSKVRSLMRRSWYLTLSQAVGQSKAQPSAVGQFEGHARFKVKISGTGRLTPHFWTNGSNFPGGPSWWFWKWDRCVNRIPLYHSTSMLQCLQRLSEPFSDLYFLNSLTRLTINGIFNLP